MATVIEHLEFNINNFRNRKTLMLNKLDEAIKRGEVDKEVLPHLEILNSFPFCFTTSSCSGRIALIDAPLVGPKYESKKAYRWHSPVDADIVWEKINSYTPGHILWLKYDSFIISLSLCSIDWATFFIKLARYLNLKDSGIRSINPRAGYVNMDFMSTEKISTPIRTRKKILIDYEYFNSLMDIANFLMQKNKIKLSLLIECLTLLKDWLNEHPRCIPELKIFDPIISRYRQKINELKSTHTFKKYELL
mgnify:CR=1 FL=1